MQSKKILIAASGSGGHLLPALYIAEEFQKLLPDSKIEFCGSGRPLEEKLIGRRGYPINIIPIVGVSRRGLLGKVEFMFKLPWAFLKTLYFMFRFKPDLVLGVGGYISVLPIILGKLCFAKTVIHEAELHPGMANRYLSYFADLATLANLETQFPGKVKKAFTGQPLNPKLFSLSYPFPTELKRILILGGSQGANKLDLGIAGLADFFASEGIAIKHQSRPENTDHLKTVYQEKKIAAEVFSFSDEIPAFYQWADLIITRSGLNTVRELELIGKPAIFVPLPKAPEQRENAEQYKQRFLAEIISESEDLSAELEAKIRVISKVILSYHPKQIAVINGSQQIAKKLVDLVSK